MTYLFAAARSRLAIALTLVAMSMIASFGAVHAAPEASPSPASSPTPAPAGSPVLLAWHLDPSVRYSATAHMTHAITYDMAQVFKNLAGHKADPTTIIDDRTADVAPGPAGAIDVSIVDVRHYGGQSKDTSSVRRTAAYKGTIAPTGKRTPTDDPLFDVGAGPLTGFPVTPVAPGQSWTLSRNVLVERDLGSGAMTYTDTLTRVDARAGHKIAIIAVRGAGRVDVTPDLQTKGFKTADITLTGSAEFDTTAGVPGVQHYAAHVQWNTRVMWTHIGLIVDDTYDEPAWTGKRR